MIHVTGALNSMFSVNFMATVSAIAADEAVKARADGGNGVLRFAENPNLDHVTGFPVVARGFKAGGDDDAVGVLVENESVQRAPPTMSSATQ